MLVICLLNNIVLRGREFCTSPIAQITGNVPRLLADIVVLQVLSTIAAVKPLASSSKVTGPVAVTAEQILQMNSDINELSTSAEHLNVFCEEVEKYNLKLCNYQVAICRSMMKFIHS